ncbi:MAG TPA: SIS domain-containing protein [Candidatus Paceibacterota bacterium]
MGTTLDLVRLYRREQVMVLEHFPVDEVAQFSDLVLKAYDRGKTVYVAANGGPAGFCDNFVTDLYLHPFVGDDKSKPVPEEVKRMKVVNLTASSATITGVMNDLGPEFIFSQQLEGHIEEHDIFLGFSGSGNSGNIIEAIKVAKKNHAIAITITRGNGGKCLEMSTLCIVIPGTSTFPGQMGKNDNNFHFEDALSAISHMAVGILQAHVRGKYGL